MTAAIKKAALLLAAGTLAVLYLALIRGAEIPVYEHLVVSAPGRVMPLFYVRPKYKDLALTFDISWGTRTLPRVLEILRRQGVKATFFLSGPWAEHHPDLVRAIVADGHEIASHGQEHVNLSQLDRAAVARNISTAHQILKRVSGQEPRFFRPPNGDYDDMVVTVARSLGYETVIWSVDSLDWKNPGADYMVKRVTQLAFPGAIVLFHASDSSRQVGQALEPTIAALRAAGYRLVTLGELCAQGEPAYDDPRGNPAYPPVDPASVPPAPAARARAARNGPQGDTAGPLPAAAVRAQAASSLCRFPASRSAPR